MFKLHPRLEGDTFLVANLKLCRLLLMNDENYPWYILVPQVDNIQEIFQLSDIDQLQLMKESNALSKFLVKQYAPDKLNIAALGNVVPQLHIHHVVRYETDLAWPAPIWGKHPVKHYSENDVENILVKARESMAELLN